MSHTLIAEFACAPGKGAEFVELLTPALADTRAFEGCELIETYVDQDNPDLVMLIEKWAARENHQAYMAWRLETGMMDVVKAFMPGEPRFVHLSSID